VRWLIPILALAAVTLAISPPKAVIEISYWGAGYVGIWNASNAFEMAFFKYMLWDCGAESYWPVRPLCSAYGMYVVPFREYRLKRATAIFNYTRAPTRADWDILKWWMQASLSFEEIDKKWGLGIEYGLTAVVVFGSGPLVNWSRVFYKGYDDWRGVYVYWWKEPHATADMQTVAVWFRWGVNKTELCVSVGRLQTERTDGDWKMYYQHCIDSNRPPVNFTVVARGNSYYVYADGQLLYNGSGPGEAWLYAGPISTKGAYSGVISAFVDANYPTLWKSGEPIKAWLFVGNDTLKLPDHAYPYVGGGYLAARVSPSPDGSTVVSPPYWRYGEQVVWLYNFTGAVTVRVGGKVYELPNGTLLTPGRMCTATGRVYRVLGDAFVALGNGTVDCRDWRVVVEKPDGSEDVFYVPNGTAFEYTPPPLDLGNGTRLVDATPIRLVVTGPARVRAQYGGRDYLIRFYTPMGTVEKWARPGEVVEFSRVVYVDNNTRLVLGPVSVVADGPKEVSLSWRREHRVVVASHNGTAERWTPEGGVLTIQPYTIDYGNGTRVEVEGFNTTVTRPMAVRLNYTVYYWVSITTPFNRTEGWARRGTLVNVTPPPFVDLGNKTALRDPNGTCAFRVDGPKRCAIVYRERLYWVSVRAPFNETVGWTPEGSVVRLPEVFDMGNGTRWVGPGFYAVVNRPVNVTLAYKRQYYVELSGVVEWRGWADEGSRIRLNETVAGGVKYVPQMLSIEVRGPASLRPKYAAYYYAQFGDVLGLPNPWTSVELCGWRFAADEAGRAYAVVETDTRCEVRAEAPPLGPYSLAIIGAVAALAAVAAVGRLRRK